MLVSGCLGSLPSHSASHVCEESLSLPSESTSNPWPSIRRNFTFLSERLPMSPFFIGCLFEKELLSEDEFKMLSDDHIVREQKIRFLLVDILPRKAFVMFTSFCEILHCVGQSHIADRFLDNPLEVKLVPEGATCCIDIHTLLSFYCQSSRFVCLQ